MMLKMRSRWHGMLRAMYMRVGFLRALRATYLRCMFHVAEKSASLLNSADNLPALQALSKRRFDYYASRLSLGGTDPSTWPTIDVFVVTCNSARRVLPFMTALLTQRYPRSNIHLRFVDHGSQDDTVTQLDAQLREHAACFASMQIIRQDKLAFGAGQDRAIRTGTAQYCLVINIDLEFMRDSLVEVVRAALCDDMSVASWELRQIPHEQSKYYDPVTLETNWSSHACILIRRSAYEKVGGYDGLAVMHAEDVELSYRFRSYGYALKYVPRARIRHVADEGAIQAESLQFSGRAIGNLLVRLRYGKAADRISGVLQYAARFFRAAPAGAKSLLLKNVISVLSGLPHFLHGKGPASARFPLRGGDYEMNRGGAFHQTQCSDTDDAPLVSVIMRTYRGRQMFLTQAMHSVFNQTHPAVELIVVEDGGDSQQALVASMAAPPHCRVRFLPNPKLGRSAAGNAGLAAATGQYLMFLDDDDLLFADHMETLVAVLSRDQALSAAYAMSFEVHTRVSPGATEYVEERFHAPAVFRQEWDYAVLQDHNFMPIQTILFKRELYDRHGGFDLELDQLEDWNLWLRYGYGKRFAYVPKTTSLFRSPADEKTRSARHALLHQAYYNAKMRAARSVEQTKRMA